MGWQALWRHGCRAHGRQDAVHVVVEGMRGSRLTCGRGSAAATWALSRGAASTKNLAFCRGGRVAPADQDRGRQARRKGLWNASRFGGLLPGCFRWRARWPAVYYRPVVKARIGARVMP